MSKISENSNDNEFRVIYESCEEGILTVDNKGVIVMANTAAHQIFGYIKDELVGRLIEDLLPASLKNKHAKHRQVYNNKPEPRRMGKGRDLLAHKKDGTPFPVEISLNTANLNGRKHVIAYVIDISERKKFEVALKKSEEQLLLYASELEKRVKERTEDLINTNKALQHQIEETKKAEREANKALIREQELNELKSRFVSMASHEFRTPLSTILSSASLIEKYQQRGDSQDKQQRHLDKIKSSINNLDGILNDFLSLSKLEEGKVNLDVQSLDLTMLCKQVIEELASLLKEHQTINFHTNGEPEHLVTDPHIVKNIIINLTSNAIKYSKRNIILRLYFGEENVVSLSVIDEGIGIPLEDQKHLFERFFRAKNATNIQGTGLGLNIVKKYVEMLHGTISFKSELNKGTEFQVTLPKTN